MEKSTLWCSAMNLIRMEDPLLLEMIHFGKLWIYIIGVSRLESRRWKFTDGLSLIATQDFEYYDPDAVTTKDGKLAITISEEPTNGFSFRSGFLSSWNKLCFTGGYIEVSLSLPGTSTATGFWPGAWTMGTHLLLRFSNC